MDSGGLSCLHVCQASSSLHHHELPLSRVACQANSAYSVYSVLPATPAWLIWPVAFILIYYIMDKLQGIVCPAHLAWSP